MNSADDFAIIKIFLLKSYLKIKLKIKKIFFSSKYQLISLLVVWLILQNVADH